MKKSCVVCKYSGTRFINILDKENILCHRYPRIEEKPLTSWCGEFSGNQKYIDSLPKYDFSDCKLEG